MEANTSAETRAWLSAGASSGAIYEMVEKALLRRNIRGETILDVGCGQGHLRPFMAPFFSRYIGLDIVQYPGFPTDCEFIQHNFDAPLSALNADCADAVIAVETIEHLENPRAFARQLHRWVRPGGFLILTTPNQLSLLSLGTLALRGRFAAFQEIDYPAHRTALLEVDLRRIAAELGLIHVEIEYSCCGRIPHTGQHWPHWLCARLPQRFSDNLLLIGQKP